MDDVAAGWVRITGIRLTSYFAMYCLKIRPDSTLLSQADKWVGDVGELKICYSISQMKSSKITKVNKKKRK